ncbi:MAG: F0F1 ATP synthase subunit gamma, partial [Bacteroidales bacterium]|nr:F0F1 ATP synthase subunit gamma [Bacteroidales bacterium]
MKSTQQITAAMKLVAASKLRKAQNAIVKLRPYALKQQEILGNLSGALEEADLGAFTEVRDAKKVLIVAFSSNRGLCGAFNTNVIKRVRTLIDEDYASQFAAGGVELLLVGRKAGEHFEKRGFSVRLRPDDLYDNLSFEKIVPLADMLMEAFRNKEYDRIVLVY